jgi:transposase-like protein
MPRCPLCESAQITVVINRHRRAFCSDCGARWVQDGSQQHTIKRIHQPAHTAPPPAID